MRLVAGHMEKSIGFSNVQLASYNLPFTSLPPKGPSQATCHAPIHTESQSEMPRPSSTDVSSEEQPLWLDDLLNEPDSPINNKTHRRSATDPFVLLDANVRPEILCLRNMWGPAWNFPMPQNLRGQIPSIRKPMYVQEQQDYNSWKSLSASPQLPNGFASPTEDAEFKALGLCCSPPKSNMTIYAGREIQEQGDANSYASENASEESDFSQPKPMLPPPASKSDVKRKQHNARRSRIRKMQHIADLERNVQALQVEGVEFSAQLEFLDQQNLFLEMENRALKQRLENLSQELLVKSLEQEILDREVGRLQYLYQMQNVNQHQQRQRHKKIPAIDRRERSCDFDSQFSNFCSNPPEVIASCNGFKDFPYRN